MPVKGSAYPDGFKAEDPEAWVEWLRIGLEEHLLRKSGAGAFRPFALARNPGDPLHVSLAALYRKLDNSPRAQAAFREAPAKVFEALEPTTVLIPVFRELLGLARGIAATSILPVLSTKLSKACWPGLADGADGRELIEDGLLTAASLPVRDSIPCIETLWRTGGADLSLAGVVLEAMCRVDPVGFDSHFGAMRAAINRMFAKYKTTGAAKKRLADNLINVIGLTRFGEKHGGLDFAEHRLPNDTWFYDALFNEPDPILSWSIDLRTLGQTIWFTGEPAGISAQLQVAPTQGERGETPESQPTEPAELEAKREVSPPRPTLLDSIEPDVKEAQIREQRERIEQGLRSGEISATPAGSTLH